MTYYILPKNNVPLCIKPSFLPTTNLVPYISQSLIYYLNKLKYQISTISQNEKEKENLDSIIKSVNTYEFIFTNVPNSILSVSKVKPESNIFYELLEIFSTCGIEEIIVSINSLQSLHSSPNHYSSIYLLNIIRENKSDSFNGIHFDSEAIKHFFSFSVPDSDSNKTQKFDFFYFEFNSYDYHDNKLYFSNVIDTLNIITQHQNNNGISIIKIDNIFCKLIVDALFILSTFFDQVYIIKPQVSNILSSDRFIVCKKFIVSENVKDIQIQLQKVVDNIQLYNLQENMIIESLIENPVSYIFINKIEESNIVIGLHQLETYDQIISIVKNKNKDEKIETLKRNHIQKCISWCDKYKIPHNKFIDKTNIFLNSKIVKDTCIKELSLSNENEYN